MKIRIGSCSLMLAAIACTPNVSASPEPEYCKVLRAFVASVEPDETREIIFRTSWLSNFKDETEPAIYAKRCEHGAYAPAEKVCAYLMKHGPIEFADISVKNSISCLSPMTKFDQRISLNVADFNFNYGSPDRGALIEITFKEDPVVGGMAFRLTADGY